MTALLGIETRVKLARLIHIVPGTHMAGVLASAAYLGGADAVMLDETMPEPSADGFEGVMEEIRAAARMSQGLAGYFGRPTLATRVRADMMCLPTGYLDAEQVRAQLNEWTSLGCQCNNATEIDAALADDAVDFLLVGSRREHLLHAARVAPAEDPASKPWFAAGNITIANLDGVLRAGAMRVAVGGAITKAPDPQAAAQAFKDRLRHAWQATPAMAEVTAAAFGGDVLGPDPEASAMANPDSSL